jgi:hypothetical protein
MVGSKSAAAENTDLVKNFRLLWELSAVTFLGGPPLSTRNDAGAADNGIWPLRNAVGRAQLLPDTATEKPRENASTSSSLVGEDPGMVILICFRRVCFVVCRQFLLDSLITDTTDEPMSHSTR